MGAIAEAFAAYAQPLLDETDGSIEELNKALSLSQLCYNLALLPEENREQTLSEMQPTLGLNDDEFDHFRRTVVVPMIERHQQMFPQMHQRGWTAFSQSPSPSGSSFWARPKAAAPADTQRRTDPYGPCPCNSGKKYKFCCGNRAKAR